LDDLYSLIESTFDFLLVVDNNEQIHYVSPLMKNACSSRNSDVIGKHLEELLDKNSLQSFRNAMKKVSHGDRGVLAVFSTGTADSIPIPMKVAFTKSVTGGFYLIFGKQADSLRKMSDREKEERAKELSCLYAVAEWIEVSTTIKDFFTKLPPFLAQGMQYPEEATVYSLYQGIEYGQEPGGDKFITVRLYISGEMKGEIRVGYINDEKDLLPEEWKMMKQVGRMLSLALERKELSENIALKQGEEKEFSNHLKKLESEIASRESELNSQKLKLKTVNSYLNSVNETMNESSRRFETMFKAIPDKVLMIDLNWNVIMSNRDDILPGEKCYRACFNRETPCIDCRLSKIVKNKTPVTVTFRDKDQYLEVHALPVFNKNEEVEGIMEFYRDVTLEKTYEQQIQQADKLASLGQLVSGIGHEINNPNQFIRGNIKIVKQAMDDMLPIIDEYQETHPDLKIARLKYSFFREHIMTLVDDMGHGSERIKGIVEGLRGFARKDEGLLVDNVDINTLICATQRLVQNEVHKHGEMQLEFSENVATFPGNSQKIEQVLVNLIVNAAQSIPTDTKGLITVSSSMDRDTVVVQIEDNGKGMDEKTQRQIFDPFFTTKRAKGGTGLGLAITYRIIEEHGGSISVSSKPGIGTKFTIRIPVADGAEEKS
ncbi:MAG: ATP-binding protein, partial [Candidatus Fermentibacteria bacterium]|nr:ATP-binding protein [Candidatus Fermentibacteria bacterium]